MDLVYLRDRVSALEEMNDQARQALEKLDDDRRKAPLPRLSRVGTFLMPVDNDKAHVCVGGTDSTSAAWKASRAFPLTSLQMGCQRVLCNEAFAVVQGLGADRNGPICPH